MSDLDAKFRDLERDHKALQKKYRDLQKRAELDQRLVTMIPCKMTEEELITNLKYVFEKYFKDSSPYSSLSTVGYAVNAIVKNIRDFLAWETKRVNRFKVPKGPCMVPLGDETGSKKLSRVKADVQVESDKKGK